MVGKNADCMRFWMKGWIAAKRISFAHDVNKPE